MLCYWYYSVVRKNALIQVDVCMYWIVDSCILDSLKLYVCILVKVISFIISVIAIVKLQHKIGYRDQKEL